MNDNTFSIKNQAVRFCLVCGALWLLALNAFAQNPVSWTMSVPHTTLKAGERGAAQVQANIESGWHLYSVTQAAGGPIPTRIAVADGQPFKLAGQVKAPAPKKKFDPNFNLETETYSGSPAFSVPFAVATDAAAGAATLNINVRYQACTDEVCLPPKTVKLAAPLQVVAGVAALSPSPTPNKNTNVANVNSVNANNANIATANTLNNSLNVNATNTVNPATVNHDANLNVGANLDDSTTAAGSSSTSSVAAATLAANEATGVATPINVAGERVTGETPLSTFLWLAITVGALSLLTPCVFPMIPITVSYFTNHAAQSKTGAARDAIIYALGIILTFTALGVALAVLFGAAGINRFAANPFVNLFIAGIFLVFAFSLLGSFNLAVPSSVLTRLDRWQRSKEGSPNSAGRIAGLLLMGLTFSLTSFTCTAPFVGTLLVMASQGDWVYPVIGMLAFSTVFALPFFILALAPQLVSQLPRSGGWLNSVKVVMGLLEIAAAMKFLSNVDLVWGWGVFTREVVLASWVAIALVIGLYLLGKFQLSHDTPVASISASRLIVALISLSLGFYLLTGLFGARLGELESFLPPANDNSLLANRAANGDDATRGGELAWLKNDYQTAVATARREGKPVFIDFTGYTCTNCRWMEANMFPKAEVKQELAKYVRVKLFTDGEGEPYEGFQAMQQLRFGTVALPLYVTLSPDEKTLATFAGLTRNENEFIEFLRKGQAEHQAQLAAR